MREGRSPAIFWRISFGVFFSMCLFLNRSLYRGCWHVLKASRYVCEAFMQLSKLFSFIAVAMLVAVVFAGLVSIPATAQTDTMQYRHRIGLCSCRYADQSSEDNGDEHCNSDKRE